MWLRWKLGLLLCCLQAISSHSLASSKRGQSYEPDIHPLPKDLSDLPPEVAASLRLETYQTGSNMYVLSHDSHSPVEVPDKAHAYDDEHEFADFDEEDDYHLPSHSTIRQPRIVNHPAPEVIYSPVEMPYDQPDGNSEEVQPGYSHLLSEAYEHSEPKLEDKQELLKKPQKSHRNPMREDESKSASFIAFPKPEPEDQETGASTFLSRNREDNYDVRQSKEFSKPVVSEALREPKVRMYQPHRTHQPQHQYKPAIHQQPPLKHQSYMRPRPKRPAGVMYDTAVPLGPNQRKSSQISTGHFINPVRSASVMGNCNAPEGKLIWTYHRECAGFPQTHWNHSFPSCGGSQQSPISINTEHVQPKYTARFALGPGHTETSHLVDLVNSGNGMEVHFNDEDLLLFGSSLPHVYKLVKMVFASHALHPEDNLRHPMEIIMIYSNLEAPAYPESVHMKDGVVIVSVRITGRNPVPQEELYRRGLIRETLSRETEELIEGLKFLINAGAALAPNQKQRRLFNVPLSLFMDGLRDGAYVYMGSLPFPPCVEGIRWIVAKGVPAIPFHTMDQLTRKLHSMTNLVNLPVTTNYRHTQPLNNRKVELHMAVMPPPPRYVDFRRPPLL